MSRSSFKLLRDLDIPRDPVVLDVGCGTGVSTFKMMELSENKGTFHGVDISQGMVDEAQKNAESSGYTNISFKRGDAESLDYPDGMFDCVISNYAIHWVPDKKQAFAEMFRVLKPGGQIALLFCGDQNRKEGSSITLKIESENPELLGGRMPFSEYKSIQIGLEDTHHLLEDIGFVDLDVHEKLYLVFVTRDFNPDKHNRVTSGWWKVGLPPKDVEKFTELVMEEAVRRVTPKGFKTTRHDIFAYAKKPL